MNILIATTFDNGGQMIALSKALNKYTDHNARLITFKQSYLDYETDVFDPSLNTVKEMVDDSDFLILGEILASSMQANEIYRMVRQDNTILRAGGSIARQYPYAYTTGIFKNVIKTGAYHDWSIFSKINPMANTVNMCHFDEWPRNDSKNGPVKVVFSGTALKHTDKHSGAFKLVWDELQLIYAPEEVELVNISGESWKNTLAIKSSCHICYDQLAIGTYANSAIEGMFYNMPTFCYANGWTKSMHPDVPVISKLSVEDILNATMSLIENRDLMNEIGNAGNKYVMQVHDAKHAVKRWDGLIDQVCEMRVIK